MTGGEMVGWHCQPDGHELERALGAGEGQEAWRAVAHGAARSRTRPSDHHEQQPQRKPSAGRLTRRISLEM